MVPPSDLTVDDLHTFYVLAGTTPVLVHNCDGEARLSTGRRTRPHRVGGMRQRATRGAS
ncbi:hypothetical protein AB0F03_17165 [Streptomyces sp. NPDC028722]|uniref:hypothetical protein n=1 Tax=Streptomyces sp. NPDC028722 TaxID=3155016 RepID=UPI0033FEE07F